MKPKPLYFLTPTAMDGTLYIEYHSPTLQYCVMKNGKKNPHTRWKFGELRRFSRESGWRKLTYREVLQVRKQAREKLTGATYA